MKVDETQRPAIWQAINEEGANLASRKEKRSTSDWIAAVTERVLAKHNVIGREAEGTAPWTPEMVLETWLTMSLQENRRLEAAVIHLHTELKQYMAAEEDNPPEPGEVPPEGTMVACLLRESQELTRGAIMSARASMSVGDSYVDKTAGQPDKPAGTVTRIWLMEDEGLLGIYAWLTPNPPEAPAGAPPGVTTH